MTAALTAQTMDRKRFTVIIFTCIVAGTTQGLLLPLLSYLLDHKGISSSVNGLNAAAIYLGMMLTSPLMERPVRRFGYKPVILGGGLTVIATLLLYPVWDNLYYWIALRLFTGAGVTALHYAAQLWVTSRTPAHQRGKFISMYGMAYGAGFGFGPLGLNLLPYGLWVPFVVGAVLFSLSMGFASTIGNDWPDREEHALKGNRYMQTLKIGLLSLIPAWMYGFMEALLTSSFTIFGHRVGLTPSWVSLCLFAFVIASLVLQIPLGIISDRFGRKKIIMSVMALGGLLFMLTPVFSHSPLLILSAFIITGGIVGSIYSLGMSYGADILPRHLLPTASVMATIGFGIASMAGPSIGGLAIQFVSPASMFHVLGGAMLAYVVLAAVYQRRGNQRTASETETISTSS